MYDVLIIGAGPAGLAAAIEMKELDENINILIVDEYLQAGGRLIGQLYQEKDGHWWNGVEESDSLIKEIENHHITMKLGTSVYDIEQNNHWIVFTNNGVFEAEKLLICTGAQETTNPVEGWTLPGVMTVGAAQVLTNVHMIKPGKKGIIVGVNVLSSAIAMELAMAGVKVDAMVLPNNLNINKKEAIPEIVFKNLLSVAHMAPSLIAKLGSKFLFTESLKKLGAKFYPRKGIKMWDIPILMKTAVKKIEGDTEVEKVTLVDLYTNGKEVPNSERVVEVDFVCLSEGLAPLTELISLTGCSFYYIEELSGYIPLHNEYMETEVKNLYVAGNVTGIEGAKIAMKQGEVAAHTIISSLSKNTNTNINKKLQEVEDARNNAAIQFHPEINEGRKKVQQLWEETV
ncbi:MAG TPA: FAD/NAD(P)-binding oxidoreductase [Pseudogracilibacillus sp.]|nr:FAD/NAD(P)-binding oxidoreductase [Pseudogracilibacillus sp.]